jgi:nitroreductase
VVTSEAAHEYASECDRPAWEALSRVIHRRRSNLRIDPDRPVPHDVLERLAELAQWAPNHKQTHPWRFAAVTGAGRERLGAAAAEGFVRQGLTEPAVLAKTRQKYLRAPVVLVIASAAHQVPYLHRENRDAVAAGVQNLLLGATALGLASYWSTGIAAEAPEVKALLGLQPEDEIVALVYLGWPLAEAPPTRRRPPTVTIVDG